MKSLIVSAFAAFISAAILLHPCPVFGEGGTAAVPSAVSHPDAEAEKLTRAPHLDRWLEHLRRKDPAQYRRMCRMRRENPGEFRRELNLRLRRRRFEAAIRQAPALYRVYQQLPPEQQLRIVTAAYPKPRLRRSERNSRAPDTPKIRKLEEASRDLARRIRNAPDEATRRKTIEELHNTLEQLFDLREKQREKQIENINRRLQELQHKLSLRHARRDEIIQRRLQELVEGDIIEW